MLVYIIYYFDHCSSESDLANIVGTYLLKRVYNWHDW